MFKMKMAINVCAIVLVLQGLNLGSFLIYKKIHETDKESQNGSSFQLQWELICI